MTESAVTLYRPVGQAELDLIRESGWRIFPPRLPSQPIFYPVLSEDYATRIARDWNAKDPNSGRVGYVTRFSVDRAFLGRYEVHQAGGSSLLEYWIPAEDLAAFNDHLIGPIEVIGEFRDQGPSMNPMALELRLRQIIHEQPYPLLFVTISGAHLYGFPSPDSDHDLRGAHVLPLRDVVGLCGGRETIESSGDRDGLELDLVTHDVGKFFSLMLKKNGYVLEQLYSPLVVHTTPEHEELKQIGKGCITRHHAHHYLGFAETQWKLFEKESPRRVKPLLYVFRVLLTGIYLMRTGAVEANLVRLNEPFGLPYIPDLIARKLSGPEQSTLDDADLPRFQSEYQRLRAELEAAYAASQLPEGPSAKEALNDLLVRLRLAK